MKSICILLISIVLIISIPNREEAAAAYSDNVITIDDESGAATKLLTQMSTVLNVIDVSDMLSQVIDESRPPEIVVEVDADYTAYVDAYAVNLRKEPSTNSEVIDTLINDEKLGVESVLVTDIGEEWYFVSTKDQKGYIMKEFTTDEQPPIYLGKYQITHYCSCEKCCDIAGRPTASGKMPREGVTVAADKSIPFGTTLIIDGHEYTVEDRGGAVTGNHIDVFVNDHERARKLGTKYLNVYMKK